MSGFGSAGLSLLRLCAFAVVTLASVPVQLAALGLRSKLAVDFPRLYHRWVLRVLGFRILRYGTQTTEHPTLFIANHASYIDIEIMGALIAGSFVAKSDVKAMPIFGFLARLQRSVFIERHVRTATATQRDELVERLRAGEDLILFPEGTSNDGNRVFPFKSSLFGAAETRISGRAVTVQPISIAYTRLNGIPIGREFRPYFAWYGDMTLGSHLWTLAGLGMTEIVVQFHNPVTIDAFGSRKKLAAHCQHIIAEGLAAANAGRLKPVPAKEPAMALPAGGGAVVTS